MSTARTNTPGRDQRGRRDDADQPPDSDTRPDDAGGGVRGSGRIMERQKRQKRRNGGIRVGSASFDWVTATGVAVLLTALVAAPGTAITVVTSTDVAGVTSQAVSSAETVEVTGAVMLVALLLAAYCWGGDVAGRMARLNGLEQGLAVWLWAVLIAVVVMVLASVAGSKDDMLSTLNGFAPIPDSADNLTRACLMVVVVVLAGALLGGVARMRFHRHLDLAGLGR